MNFKKYTSALAVSLLLVFSFAFSAAAATAVDSSADDTITGKITADGATVTVQVDLAADTGLTNGKVTVTYDTAVYTLESATLGTVAEAADISDLNTENEGTVSAALAETVGDTDGGTILTVVLIAASTDDVTTPVTVTLNEAGTADGDATVADDSFELTAVDKTDLQAAVDAGDVLEESDYTADSWAAYQEALDAAEDVLADGDATQEEVDAAYEALLAAIEGLVASTTSETVDKTDLEELAEESESLDENDYTEDSWAAYQEALEEVAAVLADENATQEEIDAAYEKLQAAIDALVAAETETTEEVTEEATNQPTEEVTDEATEADASATDGSSDDTTAAAASSDGNLSTGDRNLAPLWILLILSLAGAITLAVKGKKQTA